MKKKWLVINTGFALFSMFFGSGNLVFPIAVGQESTGHYLLATLGILSTGVLVPFLGVLAMILYEGDINNFFSLLGKRAAFWFSLFALSLMGPFGVLARCLTVAHGALLLLFPTLSLPLVSALFCLTIYLFTINKNKIVTTLGFILTPFLLLAIALIALFGLKNGASTASTSPESWPALKNGFLQGYQTMDLLAAFFFSTFVLTHLKTTAKSPLKVFFKSSLVGAGILSLVYFALVVLGWIYAPALLHTPPQELLGTIAVQALGSFAAPCVCVAVILACLTTAVVLTSLFADFMRKEVLKDKMGSRRALQVTLLIGFLVSTLEFAGIARFLGPILELTYPALIALTLINIGRKLWKAKRAGSLT